MDLRHKTDSLGLQMSYLSKLSKYLSLRAIYPLNSAKICEFCGQKIFAKFLPQKSYIFAETFFIVLSIHSKTNHAFHQYNLDV